MSAASDRALGTWLWAGYVARVRRSFRSGVLPAAILVLVLVVALATAAMHVAGETQDEGAFVLYPDLVLHGAVPQRDFQSFYGPGFPWLVAAGYIVGGPSQAVERLIGLALITLVGLLIVSLAARTAGQKVALLGALAVLPLGWTFPLAGPWLAGVALGLGSVLVLSGGRTARGHTPRRYLIGGVLAALALTFRPDMAPAVALSALPFVLAPRVPRWWYAGGAVAGLLPLAIHVAVVSPGTFLQHLVVDSVRSSSGRVLPIPPAGAVDRLAFALALGSVALAVMAAVAAMRRTRGALTNKVMLSVALLSVGYLLQALQRDDAVHTVTAEIVAIGWLPVSLSALIPHRWLGRSRIRSVVTLAAVLLGCAGSAVTYIHLRQNAGVAVVSQGREFLVRAATARDTQAMLDDVDRLARQGQRVIVAPLDMRRTNYTDTFVYFLLPQLHPGTRYLEMEPLNANRADSGLADEVRGADILVLTSAWDTWNEPNQSSLLGSPSANAAVTSRFCTVASAGPYRVLTPCST